MEKNRMAGLFERFAVNECRGSSELYEHLSLEITEDEEILELCNYSREGQPVPNLLFGAVHYLLLKGNDHSLKEYYSSISDSPKEKVGVFPVFKDFCKNNRSEIIEILQTKLVQTNEVRRCAYLYPSFCYVYDKVQKPLALVEIGTSAGLQLMWDQYCYSYGDEKVYGDKGSSLHLTAEVRGGRLPELTELAPPVSQRIGLDLHVNDVADKEDYLWLSALIWPEHHERRGMFEKASEYVRNSSARLIEGDGIEMLADVAGDIPEEYALCIFHTHVANQIPLEGKKKLLAEIEKIGQGRDVFHLYNNMKDREFHLDYYLDGKEHQNTVGSTDGHGRWFEWKL